MTSQEALSMLTSLKGQHQNEVDALAQAFDIITAGYQSDAVAVQDAIASGLASAVSEATTALTAKVTDLESTILALQANITDLNAQIVALTPAP